MRSLLGADECIALQGRVLRAYSAGEVVLPDRTHFQVAEAGNTMGFMPAYWPAEQALGLKTVGVFRSNRARGLPTGLANILLLDPATGSPLALIAASYLTSLRTAATVALAAEQLMRPGAQTLGVYGTGAIARLAVRMIAGSRALTRIVVYSRGAEARTAFAAEMSRELGIPVSAATDPQEPAAANAVVAATSSLEPVFAPASLAKGSTVLSIASRPDRVEVPVSILEGSRIVVDSRRAALRECGEIVRAITEGVITEGAIHAELGEILLGKARGRQDDSERWVFKSTGLGVQDVALGRFLYDRALALGQGETAELS